MGAWTIYTRREPSLHDAPATLVATVEPYAYERPQGYTLPLIDPDDPDENYVWIDAPVDPLAGSPWLLELRYRVTCTALLAAHDEAWAYSVGLARTTHGAIHDPQAQTFTWYGWDLDAMIAHVDVLVEGHRLGELFTHLSLARSARTVDPGPFLPLVDRVIAYLDDLPESTAKNSLLVLLANAPDLPSDSRQLLEDAVLAAPPYGKQGKPLRDLQAQLRARRDEAWTTSQPLPTSLAEIGELWDRARESEREAQVLARMFADTARHALLTAVTIAKAREGSPVPTWAAWPDQARSLTFAHVHEFEGVHRDYFALCGPLATWLVEQWRAAEARQLEEED